MGVTIFKFIHQQHLGCPEQLRPQQHPGHSNLGNNSSSEINSSKDGRTAKTLVTAGTPGTSTAVRSTAAAGAPETAETMTTTGAQAMPTAKITLARAESTATAETIGTFSLY